MIKTAVKFGLFVAVCLGFTLWLAFTIGNVGFEDRYSLTATFDDVSGLLVNDNVKVAGVPVGKVTRIEVTDGRARVTFEVRDDVRLPSDTTTASIRWRNLIGQRYLYLHPNGILDEGDVALADGDAVGETESVVDLGELFNRLGPVVAAIDPAQVNAFLDTVSQALAGNEQSLSQTLDDLALVVEGLASRDEAIARLIENTEVVAQTLNDRDEQIATMLDNLVLLADTFSDNTELLSQALDELGAFNRDLSFILEDNRAEIDRALVNLDRVVDVVGDNLDALDVTLGNLPEVSTSIFRSSADGEWLNQAILCASATKPPCPHPIVGGLDALSEGSEATLFDHTRGPAPSGAEAVLAAFGVSS